MLHRFEIDMKEDEESGPGRVRKSFSRSKFEKDFRPCFKIKSIRDLRM